MLLAFRDFIPPFLMRWVQKVKAGFQPQPWTWILPIKGSFYYDADWVEASGWLIAGRPLHLKSEPKNPHDAQAVQIILPMADPDKTALLGYIPYTHSRAVSWLLQHPVIAPTLTADLFNGYRQYQRLHLFIIIQTRLTLWQRLCLTRFKRPAP